MSPDLLASPLLRAAVRILVREMELGDRDTFAAAGASALELWERGRIRPGDAALEVLLRKAALRRRQARIEGLTPAGRRHDREARTALEALGEHIVTRLLEATGDVHTRGAA